MILCAIESWMYENGTHTLSHTHVYVTQTNTHTHTHILCQIAHEFVADCPDYESQKHISREQGTPTVK